MAGRFAGLSFATRLVECVVKSRWYAARMSEPPPCACLARVSADGKGGMRSHTLGAVFHGPMGAGWSTRWWLAWRSS